MVSFLAMGSEIVGLNQSLCIKAGLRLPGIFSSPAPPSSGDSIWVDSFLYFLGRVYVS